MHRWNPVRAPGAALLLGVLAGVAACGDDGPAGPPPATLEIVPLSGDGQVAQAGSLLDEAFQARVRESSSGAPRSGVSVRWTVTAGDGARVTPTVSQTDADGIATARLTLGTSLGEYRVEADFEGLTGSPAVFTASALVPPSISSVTAGPVPAGETVTVEGANFSSVASQNVVLFSGVRGAVVSATPDRIEARVPACLPSRSVSVSVRIGSLASNGASLAVEASGGPQDLAVGQALRLTDDTGLTCTRLAGGAGQEYLAVVSSSSQVSAAEWSYGFTGLAGGGGQLTASPAHTAAVAAATAPRSGPTPQELLDQELRELEGRLVAGRGAPPVAGTRAAGQGAPVRVPSVGERRDFQVLNADRNYTAVTAEVVHVSQRAVIYQDLNAPQNGLTAQDFASLGADFDDPIFPVDVEVFGGVSDLDDNERVAILFTPVVNSLTPRGADGFVGGFFFGLDLLVNQANSNGGEVFYALTPDAGAQFSDARSRELVMDVIPAILAHEFQHMINFNQRILVLGGTSQEALWLSEALAQMAETVVGEAFEARGEPDKGFQYRAGNWIRAERYLEDPGDVSLIVTQGQGTLEERGGGWLFLRYLRGQEGSNAFLGRLTRSTLVGVANLTAAVGRSWESLLPDWSAALYLDETGVPAEQPLLYPDLDLRSTLAEVSETYPLEPLSLVARDFQITDSLWSSSADHFLVRPGTGGSVAVALAGGDLGPAPPNARLQLTLVRVR